MKIQPLPSNFKLNGFDYTQILHKGRKYVYEQRVTPKIKHYEVFRAKIGEEVTIMTRNYPTRHLFPRNKDFGYTAWSCGSYVKAKRIFDELEE